MTTTVATQRDDSPPRGTTMKALVLTEERRLKLVDRPVPCVSEADDVLVRVSQTGICGTDRSVLVGKFNAVPGTVLGHEAVGRVAEHGHAVTGLEVGDRVVINPTLFCGTCERCLGGAFNHCTRKSGNEVGIDRHGSYAEYILLPAGFVHRVPPDMDDNRAVVIEPLACVLSNIEAASVQPGSAVIVLGGGPIGLLFALAVSHLGSPVTLIERDPYRRAFAHDFLGAHQNTTVSIGGPDDLSEVAPAPTVVDTVGSLLSTALEKATPGGTVVVMGYDSRSEIPIRPLDILLRGIRIVGAGDYNGPVFPRAVDMARRLPLERLITHRFTLDRYEEALDMLAGHNQDGYAAQKVVVLSRTEAVG